MQAEKDFQEVFGIIGSHKFSWSYKDNFFRFILALWEPVT